MTISQLIAHLQLALAERGDLEVLRDDADDSGGVVVNVVTYRPEMIDCVGHVMPEHIILESDPYCTWFDNKTKQWVVFGTETDTDPSGADTDV